MTPLWNHWVSANARCTPSGLTPTASTWLSTANNRINGVNYDGRGNQTRFNPTGLSASYNGDDLQASVADTGPGTAASYEYDGDGHRAKLERGRKKEDV